MENIIMPTMFYVLLSLYGVCFYKNGWFKLIVTNKYLNDVKYHLGALAFFFFNINSLFYCSLCSHCFTLSLSTTLVGVCIGTIVYIGYLIGDTLHTIKAIVAGKGGKFMAPFYSIGYFVLLYCIGNAVLKTGIESLHSYENKMLIVLLYPTSIVLSELSSKMRILQSKTRRGRSAV